MSRSLVVGVATSNESLFRSLLEGPGRSVGFASTPLEAAVMARTEWPCLVILDGSMHPRDRMTFLQYLKSHSKRTGQGLEVLIVDGGPSEVEVRQNMKARGADEVCHQFSDDVWEPVVQAMSGPSGVWH